MDTGNGGRRLVWIRAFIAAVDALIVSQRWRNDRPHVGSGVFPASQPTVLNGVLVDLDVFRFSASFRMFRIAEIPPWGLDGRLGECRTSRLIQPLICGLFCGVWLRFWFLVWHSLRASFRAGWTRRSAHTAHKRSASCALEGKWLSILLKPQSHA